MVAGTLWGLVTDKKVAIKALVGYRRWHWHSTGWYQEVWWQSSPGRSDAWDRGWKGALACGAAASLA